MGGLMDEGLLERLCGEGRALSKKGEWDEAAAKFTEAVQLDPESAYIIVVHNAQDQFHIASLPCKR